MNNSIVGVDLAKDVIQVCIFKGKKVQSNKEMTPSNFMEWLINSQPSTVVFEACGTSNYWNQQATKYGHDSRLISARLVDTVRQNQKNDKNDALAIVQTKIRKIRKIRGQVEKLGVKYHIAISRFTRSTLRTNF